jgi:AraC-like DNA-binding protein
MRFSQYSPHPLLKSCIVCYWVMEGDEHFTHKIIPDGHPEIVFHYGEPYNRNMENRMEKQPFAIAAGQLSKPISISPSGTTGVIGVKFSAAGMWKLFGVNMHVITNEAERLEDVLDIDPTFQFKIREASTDQERVTLLNQLFLPYVDDKRDAQAEWLIRQMEIEQGVITIKKLCDRNKISPRKLERLFRESIGLPAKTYLRLVRFNYVHKLLQQKEVSRSDVAFLAGYFDQSHLNRDFKIFTGENPSSYFTNVPALSHFFLNR